MATKSELFLFEVVLEKIQYFVDDREIAIKFDFAKIFSLDLKDPKSLHIQIPEPLPLPPEPPGKKKKKKKKPKPKKKKKGKKGKEPPPPPEPEILVGQSMLVTSSAEVLVQNMRSSPMVVSLYSKEDTLVYIGSSIINWDEVYLKYLENIYSCKEAQPVWVKDEYNIFEENTAKLVAKITLKVTLTYLTDRVTSSFRTLTEDDVIKKVLYTGMNSRKTSVMCTLKTSEGEYKENLAKIPNRFVLDKPPPVTDKAIAYADYTNAPGVALPYDLKNDYCCLGNVDKPPALKYETPEGLVDIDYICDYIRKIISSCNDNMRMLRPQPTIRPRVRATDLDKLCYCKETAWPKGDLAERFRRETQGGPCPVCVRQLDGKPRLGTEGATKRVLDVANIRGPCGRPDCRIARDIRAYLEKLVEEDNKEIRLEDIIGPCGSKECTLVDKIKDFLTHRGKFSHEHAYTKPGLSTVCACLDRMQNALIRKGSCSSICSHDCESESDNCEGKTCPYRSTSIESSAPPPNKKGTKPPEIQQPKILHDKDKNPPKDNPKKPPKPEADKKIYYVYYFTVEYDNKALDPTSPLPTSPTSPGSPTTTPTPSLTSAPTSGADTPKSTPKTPKSPKSGASTPVQKKSSTKFKHCARLCPTALAHKQSCSRSVCGISDTKMPKQISASCTNVKCPSMEAAAVPRTPSPADSNVELKFDEIRNPCCVKSCEVSERVKDLICEGLAKKSKQTDKFDDNKDPCFCDCVCEFPMGGETTYCNICGGYETLGKAVSEQPAFLQPHPCPVYHKLQYMAKAKADALAVDDDDTRSFKGKSVIAKQLKVMSSGSKTEGSDTTRASVKGIKVKSKKDKKKKGKKSKEPSQGSPASRGEYHKICHMYLEQVPKNMGWLWNAEDIPGLKFRPKWKPGACNKILARKYRTLREGIDIILKKKRALLGRRKKIEMKPTLIVNKKDGEYTVQMEIFKKFSKERLRHQYPYDEKPPLIYTIGKTEAVKLKEKKQRERKERRENRRKSKMLQSTFRDKCQEICLKAYNQAIGVLPAPNPNNPDCPCGIKQVKAPSPVIDSCSCSDTGTLSSSDTDGDDWIIEFTPPMARWDGKAKHPPITTSTESQYNYLDYKVKCLDKQGNQVPRFFKGPDGTEQCSDLGGFYGIDGTWLEINKDGYIGLDNRWVPMTFIGPDDRMYSSEEGYFMDSTTNYSWKIGIDGYIDCHNKWQWYGGKKKAGEKASIHAASRGDAPLDLPHHRRIFQRKPHDCRERERQKEREKMQATAATSTSKISEQKDKKKLKNVEGKDKSKIKNNEIKDKNKSKIFDEKDKLKVNETKDKNKSKVNEVQEKNNPKKVTIIHKGKNPVVMQHTSSYFKKRHQLQQDYRETRQMRELEMKKLARYKEIMEGLQMYDDVRLHSPIKTNRAVETRAKQITSKYSDYDSRRLGTGSRQRNFY